MNPREFKGSLPPRSCIQSRFCLFLDYEEVPGGFTVGRALGVLYMLADGRVVLDPISSERAKLPVVFSEMPDTVEIL